MSETSSLLQATALSTALTVQDLPNSMAWYRDVLGFTVEDQHEHEGVLVGAALRSGNVRVLLNQDDGGLGWERQKGEGFSIHLVTDRETVDAVADRIKEAGGTLDVEPVDASWGPRMTRFRDPDGFKWVVLSGD